MRKAGRRVKAQRLGVFFARLTQPFQPSPIPLSGRPAPSRRMLKASCWSPWPNAQLGCPSRRTARNARVAHVGLPDELERPRAAGCDLAVIDTPPGRSAETPAAVEASDFVLIPIWLESDDFDRLGKTAGTPAVGVLNFATPNSHSHEDAA